MNDRATWLEARRAGISQDNGFVIDGIASDVSAESETIDAETGEIKDGGMTEEEKAEAIAREKAEAMNG